MKKMQQKKNAAGRRTHWLRNTLIVLVICGLVGSAIAAVQFNHQNNPIQARATVDLNFDGAAQGIAPNGNAYDVSVLSSTATLEKAIQAAGLNASPEEVQACLTVTGSYPEDMVSQALSYESLLNFAANREVTLENYYPTRYTFVLSNRFATLLSEAELTGLLEQILSAGRTAFTEKYSYGSALSDIIFNLDEYDYAQQLDILSEDNTLRAKYAQELYEKDPTFRRNGTGLNDIAVRLQSLNSSDIARLNADLTMNALTRDTARMMTQYQYEIQDLSNQISKQQDRLARMDALIAAYDKNEIIYLSTSDSLTKIDGNSSETYDALISSRREIADGISELNAEIQEYTLKLSDLLKTEDDETAATVQTAGSVAAAGTADTADSAEAAGTAEPITAEGSDGAEASDALPIPNVTVAPMSEEEIAAAAQAAEEASKQQIAALESSIAEVIAKREGILTEMSTLIQSYMDQRLNEGNYVISAVEYKAPSLISGAFIKSAIKVAGPLCAVGFMICLVGLILSRRKERLLEGK